MRHVFLLCLLLLLRVPGPLCAADAGQPGGEGTVVTRSSRTDAQAGELDQLRLEMLKMEGEIEKMRAANLKLQNENLQLQMQLKQQTGNQVPSSAPQTQAPPTPSQAQPTLGK